MLVLISSRESLPRFGGGRGGSLAAFNPLLGGAGVGNLILTIHNNKYCGAVWMDKAGGFETQ